MKRTDTSVPVLIFLFKEIRVMIHSAGLIELAVSR